MTLEAIKLGREALKVARNQIVDPDYAPIGWSVSRLDEVLQCLDEALAEQPAQQEPVGYVVADEEAYWIDKPPPLGSLLYTSPPQRKPLTDEMRKQMKERCDSMEMRGAFADGWLSAEAAHGIKE